MSNGYYKHAGSAEHDECVNHETMLNTIPITKDTWHFVKLGSKLGRPANGEDFVVFTEQDAGGYFYGTWNSDIIAYPSENNKAGPFDMKFCISNHYFLYKTIKPTVFIYL